MTDNQRSGWGETIRTVLYAVLIALFVRTFAYEPFNIPSGSMVPTLLVGDYLFVSKYSYGYSRYSLPFSPPIINGRVWESQPERGDVIVFKLPRDNETDYIKRLIGLPGDKVQVKGGILHINGEQIKRDLVEDQNLSSATSGAYQVKDFVVTLPDGRQHLIREESDSRQLDNTRVFTVPQGQYMFLGDNRDRSQDSRDQSKVGFVPFENLVGRAEFLFFSHNGEARWWEIWRWPTSIRWRRIGSGIE